MSQHPAPDSDAHNLGDLADLADGETRAFEDIGEYGIVVCNVGGDMYALEDNCSHADTPLSEGRLRGFHITCPLHGCLLYTSPSPRDATLSRMPSSA